ncbi:MAG TPA: flagellin [Candidatus Acidoferrum sp.]|nr:flagellin [Candidatus Acidoferrum sp.]
MGIVVNTNTSAMNTATLLSQSNTALQESLARLSSGSKITSPADDSAGLAVSLNLVAQEGENTAASNNISDAISYNQTQNGYLSQVTSALDRMSELSVQAQDVTKSNADRSLYQQEFSTLAAYVNNVSTENFNGVSLFNGTSLNVTIDSSGNTFAMAGVNLTATTFSTLATQDVSTIAGAVTAETSVSNAITQIGVLSAGLGANEETLNDYNSQLATLNNNLAAANSTIMDVNVATESSNYAKENILVQTGTAMLAQANALPQIALKLI